MVGSVLAGDRQKLAGYCFGVFDSEIRRGIPPPLEDTQGPDEWRAQVRETNRALTRIRKELHSRHERLRIYLMGVPLDSQVVAAIRFGREDESLCAQALGEFADAAMKGAQAASPEVKQRRLR
jgi:hypothetical protein